MGGLRDPRRLADQLTAIASTAKLNDWPTIWSSIAGAATTIAKTPLVATASAVAGRMRSAANGEMMVGGPFASERAALFTQAAEVLEKACADGGIAAQDVKARTLIDVATQAAEAGAVKLGQDLAGIHHGLLRKRMAPAEAAERLAAHAALCALRAKAYESLCDELNRLGEDLRKAGAS